MTSILKPGFRLLLIFIFTTVSVSAQKPEIIVQKGSGSVRSVAFSPDGKILASGGDDGTIKLWEVATGRELRSFSGRSPVAFRSDGRTLAGIGDNNNTIKLWDIITGKELRTLSGHTKSVGAIIFSLDGKTLASGSDDQTIKLWDAETGKELQTLPGKTVFRAIAFSPDGKSLASGGNETYDSPIKLWDIKTGAQVRTFYGHSTYITSVAISPDGKILASGSGTSEDSTIKLWDIVSGQELKTLSGHNSEVLSIAFSPDSTRLASAGFDKEIKLWDVATGQESRILSGHSDVGWAVAFSPDGRTLASGSYDQTIKLWDVGSGREAQSLSGHSFGITSLAFSPDGKLLASGYEDDTRLWGLTTGKELRNLSTHSPHARVAFSGDRKMLANGNMLWDVTAGRILRTLSEDQAYKIGSSVAFSPDGTLALTTTFGSLELWDVKTGRRLPPPSGLRTAVLGAFSPDGKTLAMRGRTSENSAIRFWDLAAGVELRTWSEEKDSRDLLFSPDAKTLATIGTDNTIKLRDVSTGTQLGILKGHSSDVDVFAFSPDGKTLASGSRDTTIRLWDVATRKELRIFYGHSTAISTVAFSPDGKILASGGYDKTIKLWDLRTGEQLASLIAFDKDDWVVVTPDGLFDGSPASWNKLLWRFSSNLYDVAPIEAFFSDFYQPGLLTDIFAGKRPKATSDITQKDRRQPQLKLKLADAQPGKPLAARNATLRIDVSQALAGAQDVRLFRNSSLIKVWHGDVLKGQSSVTLEAAIQIVAGENLLTAYAFNRDNIKSSDATLTITGADSLKRKGVGYVLAVGLNEYANSQYNLKYAVADAQGFAEQLKLQQAKLNNYERVEVIALNDKDARKANILNALVDLSARVQPEDALVIFFAGHGTAQQNRFYLIPHDLGYSGSRTALDSAGLQSILSHSISDEELERAVEGVDAGQMLLVIDACNSGQALDSEEKRRGPMNSKGLAQLAYEKGMYILTAAQSYQAANEASRLGHGYLTYALVEEGLKTNIADREPRDGQVLLREWLDFATERVPQMQQDELDQQKKQGRQLEQIKFAETDSGSARSLQRPRVFYRRETETNPLVVARP